MYRITNWNIERPKVDSLKTKLVFEKILALNSDIIVLTESSNAINLNSDYPFYSATNSFARTPDEQWVAIYSKWPIVENYKTESDCRTVCSKIKTPFSDIIIYGTIIPYHMAGVNGNRYDRVGLQTWQYHEEDIIAQSKEWEEIQNKNPNTPFFIIGDFNQTRGEIKGYGTDKCRDLLSSELQKLNIECITEINFENNNLTPDPKTNLIRKNIDHICVSKKFISRLKNYNVSAFNNFTKDGTYMSDHNGIVMDFEI